MFGTSLPFEDQVAPECAIPYKVTVDKSVTFLSPRENPRMTVDAIFLASARG